MIQAAEHSQTPAGGETVAERNAATSDFVFNQTMLRVKDPARSVKFYTEVLGMTLVRTLDFPDMKFTLYFLAYLRPDEAIPADPAEQATFLFRRPATLELTHNWGTEADPAFEGYHNGNTEPRGFGHLGISVVDIGAACERFEALGVTFVKRLEEGKLRGIAFVADPDGYWIEILSAKTMGAVFEARGAD
jgi:lactoylglutathione lyase